MRIISFLRNGTPSWGVLDHAGTAVTDLGSRPEVEAPTLAHALSSSSLMDIAGHHAGEIPDFGIHDVTLLPPVPSPSKILCVGLNYGAHAAEMGRDEMNYPTMFTRFADSVVGDGQPLLRPTVSDKFDYEGELAVVIGSRARYVSEETAREYIAGYTLFNDGTLRDFQRHTSQFIPGKNFPRTASMGPALVTRDEFDDLESSSLRTVLNGNIMQEAKLGEMIFSVEKVISYCSQWTTLHPGDVIAMGTPSGVGARQNPPVWMQPGDRISIEIDGLGRLQNSIASE